MLSRVFSTRAGAIVVALLLAAVAVAVVVIYAGNYRSSVKDSGTQVPVLVATRQIDQFTPGTQVVDGSMFRTQTVPADSRVDGAVTNPSQLKGLVAKSDIYPGEQLTTNQFEKVSGGTRIRLIQRGSPGGGGLETDVQAFGDEPMRASRPFATWPAKLPVWVCTWSPIEYGVQAPYCTSSAVFGVPLVSP